MPAANLKQEDFGKLFGDVCGRQGSSCDSINGNVTTGSYGPFSFCNDTEKLGFVLDSYYKNQKSDASACNFNGQAVTTKPAAVASTCNAVLSSATSTQTSKSFAAPVPMHGMLTLGELTTGLYVLLAMGLGGWNGSALETTWIVNKKGREGKLQTNWMIYRLYIMNDFVASADQDF